MTGELPDSLFADVIVAKNKSADIDRVVNGKRTRRISHRPPKVGDRVVISLDGTVEEGAVVVEIGYVLLKTTAGEYIIAAQQWELFPKRAATDEDNALFETREAPQ